MSWWSSPACLVVVFGGAASLYALHRICLRLEDAGYMYYLRKKPGGSGGFRSLIELQQALEPTTRYVVETKEERVLNVRSAEGEGDSPRNILPQASDATPEHDAR